MRSSGILLHPTSLPGPYGIGDLGRQAYAFADFLVRSGQTLWQMLPLGPTDEGGSPYAGYSAFAGNTLLISPERLIEKRLATDSDLAEAELGSSERVNFPRVQQIKDSLLRTTYQRYKQTSESGVRTAYEAFKMRSANWLDDYALFRALKDVHAGAPWHQWEPPLKHREMPALNRERKKLQDEIEAQKFYQFLFFDQWFALKRYCNQSGLKIVGDLPIFVAHDSADVWTNPKYFKLDDKGIPTVVSGVPPDYFSSTGQLWGNPLYNWEQMRADGFKWWIRRLKAILTVVDIVRLDHFRGFAACWEIPAGDQTAERGRWVDAPGRELFTSIRNAVGDLPLIAEDLGVITREVDALRDEFSFPGTRVMHFGFGGDITNLHLPHNYPRNVAAYTATHDSNTTVGWFNDLSDQERQFCLQYLKSDGRRISWDLIEAVCASAAERAIVPLQDILELGGHARMNLPNTVTGNWMWRCRSNAVHDALATRLRKLTNRCGRIPMSIVSAKI